MQALFDSCGRPGSRRSSNCIQLGFLTPQVTCHLVTKLCTCDTGLTLGSNPRRSTRTLLILTGAMIVAVDAAFTFPTKVISKVEEASSKIPVQIDQPDEGNIHHCRLEGSASTNCNYLGRHLSSSKVTAGHKQNNHHSAIISHKKDLRGGVGTNIGLDRLPPSSWTAR